MLKVAVRQKVSTNWLGATWRGLITSPTASLILRLVSDQGTKHWRAYTFAFACMAVVAGATAGMAWLMRDVIDKVFIAKEVSAVWIISSALVCLSLAKGLATYGQQVILARVANSIVADLQKRIYEKMLAMSVGYFGARHSTEFIARQSFITQSVSSALNMLVTAFARDTLTMIGLLTIMILQDPLMSVMALIVMPFAVIGTRRLSGRVKKVIMTEFAGFSNIMESLQETAQGIRIVKAFTLEASMRRKQHAAIDAVESAANKLALVGARSSPMMETLGGLAIAIVVTYGGSRVINDGAAPGAFFSFITALLLAYEPAKRVARLHLDLSACLPGVAMVYAFLEEPSAEHDPPDCKQLSVGPARIEFRNVCFSYRPGEPVLSDLSFVAEGGRTTALVGRSGAGKSTVMSAMLRYWEMESGAILIDGQDISKVSRGSLRRAVSYVSQETFLFKGTVRENIAIGLPGASEDQIVAAAKAAFAHDFISSFEFGYDTPCGEHGMQLSGGQRQRIAIARAFLKNAPILLLDEATSALDTESERAVQDALDRLREGRTTLVIAHRLSTVRKADKILYLENGKITQRGTLQDLHKLRNSLYAAMVDAEFQTENP